MGQRFGIQRNEHAANAIKVVREGGTRGQQNRALMDKVMLTGAQAGVGAIGHIIEADRSIERQDTNRRRDIMGNAIADQTKLAGQQDQIRKSSQQYAGPDYQAPTDNQRPMPDWMGEGGEATPEALKASADLAISRQKTNVSALGQSVGGYDTPDGIETQHQAAGSAARDMATGDGIMKMGGMMNSLPRVRR